MRLRTLPLMLIALCALIFVACGQEEQPNTSDDALNGIVPEGKADNYFSDVGQEYTVTGVTYGVVDAACLERHTDSSDAQKRCVLESVGLKNFAIAWFLNTYIIDKHDAPNEDWGGYTAMTRPGSFEALDTASPDADGKFEYTFTSELSGPLDLLDDMPTEPCPDGDTTERCFVLEIPVVDNATLAKMDTGDEWYRSAPYNKYSPETYTGEKESMQLRIKVYPRSNDAYLEYNKLFDADQLAKAGDKLAIGLFVGWDYYDDRYDLQTATELYRWLTVDQGFESPVDSYDDYKIDSGELTKTINVGGNPVQVGVILVHPGQGDPGTAEFAGQMKAELVKAFGERQIIAFEGHAGPLYGFALGNWRATEAGELDDEELPLLDIPSDFYQVVMASGCDTYMVADSLYRVPVKSGRTDLDMITTTSFSNAAGRGRTTKALLEAVINQDDNGDLEPQTWGTVLRELNSERWMTPIYGVHGIDDNPRDNPFANKSLLCQTCETDADCGGNGNMCVSLGNSEVVCTTLCRTDDDCPAENKCYSVYSGNTIVSNQCAPRTLTCQ